MSLYAENTRVTIEKSQNEIKRLLQKHGLTKYAIGEEKDRTTILAVIEQDKQRVSLRFSLTLPDPKDPRIIYTPSRKYLRTADERTKAYADEVRRRWRALLLLIKARFEAVEAQITTLAEEFLPNVVLPNGESVAEWALRDIGPAIAEGRMPATLNLGAGVPSESGVA